MVKHSRAITAILIAVLSALTTTAVAYGASAHRASRIHGRLSTRTPLGVPGQWRLVFDDEFNGNALNQNTWDARNGWTNQNDVTDHLSNIRVTGGHLILRLASARSGAAIGSNHFSLAVGEYAQARIKFAGAGQTVYNWPAWWVSGPNWPAAGENDIAEGLGPLTINYHSPAGAFNTGSVRGNWAGSYHTYGIFRSRLYSRVYWDGRLVRTYRTDDDGAPQMLIFTMGYAHNGTRPYTGASGQMVVDYVRAWAHA